MRSNKRLQHACWIQEQYINISCISIYKQYILENKT